MVEPDDIEGDVGGPPAAAQEVVEHRPAGLVGRDHLTVDYRFVDIEQPANLVAERLETAQDVAVARDEAATALLDVAQRSKAIVFEVEESFRVVERLLSPRRDDRLYAGKCHPVNMGATA